MDQWLPGFHKLSDLARTELRGDALNQRVSDYVTDNGRSWDWDKLNQILPDCSGIFMAINVPNQNADEDSVAWFTNIDGKFSLKTTYSSWFDSF